MDKNIIECKAKIKLIKDLIENYSFELDGGYWRAVLEGKLDGIAKNLEVLEKEN